MKPTLWGRLAGCYVGFLSAGAVLPGLKVESWPVYAVGCALAAILYFFARLITRPIAVAFDLLLLGIPRLFLDALPVWGILALAPGAMVSGYWTALGAVLLASLGMWIGRLCAQKAKGVAPA